VTCIDASDYQIEEQTVTEELFDLEGIPVNYYHAGQGRPLLLLHGSGPGASSIGNWKAVLEPLAQRFEIYAMDLIGFGKSGRKSQEPYFDYGLWMRQAAAMLERIPGQRVGVIGHSLSASIGLTLAAQASRVGAVMTTGAMGAKFKLNDGTRRTWTCPRTREELVRALSGLIHDTSGITDDYLRTREQVIFAPGYADYFDTMFKGNQQQYIDAAMLSDSTLERITCPVLMLHGRNDGAFPTSNSIALAQKLAHADLMLISACSHSVAAERADTFMALAHDFFNRTLQNNESLVR
jgi:2-hydroxymuconate-semialdehyde hydrolase